MNRPTLDILVSEASLFYNLDPSDYMTKNNGLPSVVTHYLKLNNTNMETKQAIGKAEQTIKTFLDKNITWSDFGVRLLLMKISKEIYEEGGNFVDKLKEERENLTKDIEENKLNFGNIIRNLRDSLQDGNMKRNLNDYATSAKTTQSYTPPKKVEPPQSQVAKKRNDNYVGLEKAISPRLDWLSVIGSENPSVKTEVGQLVKEIRQTTKKIIEESVDYDTLSKEVKDILKNYKTLIQKTPNREKYAEPFNIKFVE